MASFPASAPDEQSETLEEPNSPDSPNLTDFDISSKCDNIWATPQLGDDGWHIESGSSAEKHQVLTHFNLEDSPVDVDLMKQWYVESPWNALRSPHRFILTALSNSADGTPCANQTIMRGLITLNKPTIVFYPSHYDETFKVKGFGRRTRRWLVCCYLSPTKRIVRCVDNFVSSAERNFPFAVANLTLYSVHNEDREYLINPICDAACQRVEGGVRQAQYTMSSPVRGNIDVTIEDKPFKYLKRLGPGFWNLRVPFNVFHSMINIGNHMSFVRLPSNGKLLCFGAVDPSGPAHGNGDGHRDLKRELDRFTECGRLIEAVIATHPFHTIGFKPFYLAYSAGMEERGALGWFGTPRHIRRIKPIPWKGCVSEGRVRALWECQGVFMKLPDGAEFDDPQPPRTNHFANLFVYHAPSRTVHNDDCLCYYDHPRKTMGVLTTVLPDISHDTLVFHRSISEEGLLPNPSAPLDFSVWMDRLLDEWDFDNLTTAHNACICGGAKSRVTGLMADTRSTLASLSRAKGATAEQITKTRIGRGTQRQIWKKENETHEVDDRLTRTSWYDENEDFSCECG